MDLKPSSKPRWLLILPMAFIFGIAVDYYVLHILFPVRNNALAGKLTVNTSASKGISTEDKNTPLMHSQPADSQNTEAGGFQDILADCAPELAEQKLKSPTDLVNFLINNIGIKNEEVDIENYNFTLADGSERRIHLIPAENSNSKTFRELHYFKLDSEGFPKRIYIPKNQAINPSNSLLAEMMENASIHLHQIKKRIVLKDESSLALDIINDQTEAVQFFGKLKSLNCEKLLCQCR